MSILKGITNISDIYRQHEEYLAANPVDPDAPSPVEVKVAELKQNDKYKGWEESELRKYAMHLLNYRRFTNLAHTIYADSNPGNNTRPDNKVWNAYSYEEIIKMEGIGANIPKDVLNWAHSMQDKDVTTYQVTDENEDVNATTFDSGDEKQDKLEKQAFELTKKAKEKKTGLFTDFEKFVPLTEKAKQIKADSENEEKNAVKKAEKLIKEWTELDKKVQKGTGLTTGEQKRYRELGIQLNGIDGETTKMLMDSAADLDDLTKTMDRLSRNVIEGLDVGTKAAQAGVSLADYEKGYHPKRTAIIETFVGVTGEVADQLFGAQGQSIARDAVDIGVDLHNYSFKIDEQINTNTNAALYEFSGNYKGVLQETVDETKEEMGDNFNVDGEDFKEMELKENQSAKGLRQSLNEEGVGLKQQGLIFAQKSEEKAKDTDSYTQKLVRFEEQDQDTQSRSEELTSDTEKKLQPKVKKYNKLAEEILAEYEDIDVQNKNSKKVNGPATSETKIIKEEDKTADEKEEENENTEITEDGELNVKTPATPEEADNTEVPETAENKVNENNEEDNQNETSENSKIKTADQISSNDPKLQELEKQQKDIINIQNKAQIQTDVYSKKIAVNKNSIDTGFPKIEDTRDFGSETVDIGSELIGGFGDGLQKMTKAASSPAAIAGAAAAGGIYGVAAATAISFMGSAMQEVLGFFGERYRIGFLDLEKGGNALQSGAIADITHLDAVEINETADKSVEQNSQLIDEAGIVEKTPKDVETEVAEKQAEDAEKEMQNQPQSYAQNGIGVNLGEGTAAIATTTTATGEVVPTEDATVTTKDEETDPAEQKEASKEDQKEVDKADKDAEKTDKAAQDDAKDAKKEEKDTNKKIKNNEKEHKLYQKQMETMLKKQEQMSKEIDEMMIKMEEFQAEQSTEQNNPAPTAAPMAINMPGAAPAANGEQNNAPVTNTASLGLASEAPAQNDKAQEIQAMGEKLPHMLKAFAKNDKTIHTIQTKSKRSTKNLNKLYKTRQKENQIKAKKEQDRMDKNEKTKEIITTIGQAFTITKTIGNMMIPVVLPPWVSPMGQIMFYVGKYGEISCSLTNAAIDACNGNLVGALVNVGAAAMSAASGPASAGASQAGTQGVSEAAKESAAAGMQQVTEASKQFADQTLKAATENTMQNMGQELFQQTANSSLEALKAVGETSLQSAATEVVKDTTVISVQSLGIQALETQALDFTLAPMAQQAVKETGKSFLKDTALNAAKSGAGSLVQQGGAYLQQKLQKGPEEQKKKQVPYNEEVMKRLAAIQANNFTHNNTTSNNDQNNILALDNQKKKRRKVAKTSAGGQKNQKQFA